MARRSQPGPGKDRERLAHPFLTGRRSTPNTGEDLALNPTDWADCASGPVHDQGEFHGRSPVTTWRTTDAKARAVKNRASTGAGPSAPEPSTRTGDIEAPSLIAGAPDVSPGLSNIPPAQA